MAGTDDDDLAPTEGLPTRAGPGDVAAGGAALAPGARLGRYRIESLKVVEPTDLSPLAATPGPAPEGRAGASGGRARPLCRIACVTYLVPRRLDYKGDWLKQLANRKLAGNFFCSPGAS